MYNGHLCCEARRRDILEHVGKYGYQECVRCLEQVTHQISEKIP